MKKFVFPALIVPLVLVLVSIGQEPKKEEAITGLRHAIESKPRQEAVEGLVGVGLHLHAQPGVAGRRGSHQAGRGLAAAAHAGLQLGDKVVVGPPGGVGRQRNGHFQRGGVDGRLGKAEGHVGGLSEDGVVIGPPDHVHADAAGPVGVELDRAGLHRAVVIAPAMRV